MISSTTGVLVRSAAAMSFSQQAALQAKVDLGKVNSLYHIRNSATLMLEQASRYDTRNPMVRRAIQRVNMSTKAIPNNARVSPRDVEFASLKVSQMHLLKASEILATLENRNFKVLK